MPRDLVVPFLKNTLRKEGEELTNQPAYQVLKIDSPPGSCSSGEPTKSGAGSSRTCDEEKIAERNANRAARAAWYVGKKGKGPPQGSRSTYHWAPEHPEGSEAGSYRQPQGSKGYHPWGQGKSRRPIGTAIPIPTGARGNWGKATQGDQQGGAGTDTADAWKDYNSTRGVGSDYQDRESNRGDASCGSRGWRKGW